MIGKFLWKTLDARVVNFSELFPRLFHKQTITFFRPSKKITNLVNSMLDHYAQVIISRLSTVSDSYILPCSPALVGSISGAFLASMSVPESLRRCSFFLAPPLLFLSRYCTWWARQAAATYEPIHFFCCGNHHPAWLRWVLILLCSRAHIKDHCQPQSMKMWWGLEVVLAVVHVHEYEGIHPTLASFGLTRTQRGQTAFLPPNVSLYFGLYFTLLHFSLLCPLPCLDSSPYTSWIYLYMHPLLMLILIHTYIPLRLLSKACLSQVLREGCWGERNVFAHVCFSRRTQQFRVQKYVLKASSTPSMH